MKNFKIEILALFLLLWSCDTPIGFDDSDLLPNSDIPAIAQAFIQTNYNGYQIKKTKAEDFCNTKLAFEVELEDGPGPDVNLYFDESWTFVFSGEEISSEDLPNTILEAIEPFLVSDLVEIEHLTSSDKAIFYKLKIELATENHQELILDASGVIICSDSDDNDDNDNDDNGQGNDNSVILPDSIASQISEAFATYQIVKVKTEDFCDGQPIFEIELEDGQGPNVDLYYDADWNFLFQGNDFDPDLLPMAVKEAINAIENASLVPGELEILTLSDGKKLYKIELKVSIGGSDEEQELIMDADGQIVCKDSSDDDDDDDNDNDNDNDGDSATLPQAVQDFIKVSYKGYSVESAEKEDLCDDRYYYKVELEDGPGLDIELFYSLDWILLFERTEIVQSKLPAAVLVTITDDYPNVTIEEDELYQLVWVDGRIQYEMELELDSQDDIEVIFNADGSIDCLDD
jgi:hypothetical protein